MCSFCCICLDLWCIDVTNQPVKGNPPGTDAFWGRTLESLNRDGKTILVGANVSDAKTPHYFNAIVIRGADRQRDFLQRIPIPIAMWAPYGERGVPLRLDGAGTLDIAGRRAAVLICYEHLLIWPVLTSFAQHPTVLLGIANDYWARETTVAAIQRSCLTNWARLFHVPMLWARTPKMTTSRYLFILAITLSSLLLCQAQTRQTKEWNDQLTPEEFRRLAAACARDVPLITLRAIARTESAFHPYALSLDYPQRTAIEHGFTDGGIFLARQPRNLAEAHAWAEWLLHHGRSVSIGLMQVSTRHAADLALTADQLFDPCANIRAGAQILKAQYRRAAAVLGEGQEALEQALSEYNSGSSVLGFANGYVSNVVTGEFRVVDFEPPLDNKGTKRLPRMRPRRPAASARRPLPIAGRMPTGTLNAPIDARVSSSPNHVQTDATRKENQP